MRGLRRPIEKCVAVNRAIIIGSVDESAILAVGAKLIWPTRRGV